MGASLRTFLDLPPFLFSVFLLYWALPIACFAQQVQLLKLKGPRSDALGWAVGLQKVFRVRHLILPGPKVYRSAKGFTIYLSNHRSWADFFIDVLTTEGHAMMLSRWAVFFVFPMFMAPVYVVRHCILFRRGKILDKEAFNDFLDKKLRESFVNGLIVYPEGHRSTKPHSLPLKRGMLHFAYDRKHAVQVVITSNKEAVIAEKAFTAGFNQTILTGYGEPLFPGDYSTFSAFMDAVQLSWDTQWQRVYSSSREEGREGAVALVQDLDYPPHVRAAQLFIVPTTCLLLLLTLYYCAWLGLWLLARLPAAFQLPFLAGTALYLGLSFYLAFQPKPMHKGNGKKSM